MKCCVSFSDRESVFVLLRALKAINSEVKQSLFIYVAPLRSSCHTVLYINIENLKIISRIKHNSKSLMHLLQEEGDVLCLPGGSDAKGQHCDEGRG